MSLTLPEGRLRRVLLGASPWLFELCRRASRAIFARPQLSASPEAMLFVTYRTSLLQGVDAGGWRGGGEKGT